MKPGEFSQPSGPSKPSEPAQPSESPRKPGNPATSSFSKFVSSGLHRGHSYSELNSVSCNSDSIYLRLSSNLIDYPKFMSPGDDV